MSCPLCLASDTQQVFEKTDPKFGRRIYHRCPDCQLIFLLPEYFLSPEEEKKRYDLHRNHPGDQGYVDFLNQMVEPLCGLLPLDATGMDYGCGPGPTVSGLMKAKGVRMVHYDPIYFSDQSVLAERYDVVTATEVIEHFRDPRREMAVFDRMLKPGGHLSLMTYLYEDVPRFKEGWYHADPTHVCFYHRATVEWIAGWLNWEIKYITGRVIIFQKTRH